MPNEIKMDANRYIVQTVIEKAGKPLESKEVYLLALEIKQTIQYSVVKKYLKKLSEDVSTKIQRVECQGKGPGGRFFRYVMLKK